MPIFRLFKLMWRFRKLLLSIAAFLLSHKFGETCDIKPKRVNVNVKYPNQKAEKVRKLLSGVIKKK